jgi:hypothetical protein
MAWTAARLSVIATRHYGAAAAAGDDGGTKAIAAEVWQQPAETRKAPARGWGSLDALPGPSFGLGGALQRQPVGVRSLQSSLV